MDAYKSKVSSRSYVTSWKFGFGLYLIRCLQRHRVGCHLASFVCVTKKEHSDFWAGSSIFQYMLQLAIASSPLCSLDVALSKTVFCVHAATSSVMRLTCGAPTADARSSMKERKRIGDRTDPSGTPGYKITVRHLAPSSVTKVYRLNSHGVIHRPM